MIPDEVVMSKIYVIRDVNVMIDRDLAELYGVENRKRIGFKTYVSQEE